ncbi:hypothetical protein ABMA28_002829 [Loxostege sticticalis]|uniref:Uncharacterized protein n=1 Tax=Loxostege sticticalis TaxID=481309 RepID=A0ABD0T2E5_LOXSC
MSGLQETSSFNSSVASSHLDSQDDMETAKAKHFVKELLKARIFLGRYIERRLIDQRIGYRDVILVSAAEVELKRDLVEAQHLMRSAFPNIHWIGIADSEILGVNSSGLCLCTEIENQPFGPFWFQIKSIRFRNEEIMIALKCIRHISDSYLEIEPILTRSSTKKVREANNDTKPDSSVETLGDTYNEILVTLKSALSIRNVKEFVTFLFAFVIAIFTGSTAFVNFLGNFILALLREMSILIKNSTPMFLGLLDFFSKIVGGFYILLAMFFKPSNPVPPPNKRSIAYYNQRHYRSDQFSHDGQFD